MHDELQFATISVNNSYHASKPKSSEIPDAALILHLSNVVLSEQFDS
jgi:hypothetical protein